MEGDFKLEDVRAFEIDLNSIVHKHEDRFNEEEISALLLSWGHEGLRRAGRTQEDIIDLLNSLEGK